MIEDAPGGVYSPGMGTYKPKKMKEGREKSNVKPPYWECKDCKHRAPYYDFERGMWWWLTFRCPKCKSEEFKEATKRGAPPPSPQRPTFSNLEDKRHLMFIYKRLTDFHLENPKVNYMIKFKSIIDRK